MAFVMFLSNMLDVTSRVATYSSNYTCKHNYMPTYTFNEDRSENYSTGLTRLTRF